MATIILPRLQSRKWIRLTAGSPCLTVSPSDCLSVRLYDPSITLTARLFEHLTDISAQQIAKLSWTVSNPYTFHSPDAQPPTSQPFPSSALSLLFFTCSLHLHHTLLTRQINSSLSRKMLAYMTSQPTVPADLLSYINSVPSGPYKGRYIIKQYEVEGIKNQILNSAQCYFIQGDKGRFYAR